MNSVETKELKELLIKGWMTHDGMWFYHSLQEFGIEKILGVESIKSFYELKSFLLSAFDLVMADFMEFGFEFKEPNILEVWWEPEKCFAYQGVKQIGVIDDYQCGIFDRTENWYEGLGLNFTVSPKVSGCMMHTDGKCFRRYEFDFRN